MSRENISMAKADSGGIVRSVMRVEVQLHMTQNWAQDFSLQWLKMEDSE